MKTKNKEYEYIMFLYSLIQKTDLPLIYFIFTIGIY